MGLPRGSLHINTATVGDSNLYPDQKYVRAFLINDHKLIAEIYALFAPKVIGYIQKNSGDEAAARDIIQETLMTLYDQAKTKGLALSCPFDAYFFYYVNRSGCIS